jgi:hypothetical protein
MNSILTKTVMPLMLSFLCNFSLIFLSIIEKIVKNFKKIITSNHQIVHIYYISLTFYFVMIGEILLHVQNRVSFPNCSSNFSQGNLSLSPLDAEKFLKEKLVR